ncbi:MAG: DUF5696 domain-containing protein [Treponema sp.]|nr:DUF5696 domain-containing protein [Treponema sp.]
MKKVIWLFAILYVLFLCGSCAADTAKGKAVVVYSNNGSRDPLVIENEFLKLSFLPDTAEIILTDKATGVLWRSNPSGYSNDPLSDTVTKVMMGSQFVLEYANVSGTGMSMYSASESVAHGSYDYALVGGGIEVNYTVGNLARTYLLPLAVPEERLSPFLVKMDSGDRSRFLSVYRLYDINNLRPTDNKSALLSAYPDLARKKIYVRRDDAQEYMKKFAEDVLKSAGYTYEDFIEDSALYPAADTDDKPAFNVTLDYTLDGKTLVVKAPFDRIAYRRSFPVVQLSILPYMGAGGLSDKGYLFVPDGSGALINFNNRKQSQIAYNNAIYGWDEGMPRDAIINDNSAPFPVFGIERNGSALLCVIEDGASYASVRADVSGRNSSWNNVYPRFDMVHGAKMDISEWALYLYENGLPGGEGITMRYTVCDNDGYVGMAKQYRSYLLDKYPSLGAHASVSNGRESGVPVAVEILGAVNKIQHRIGIPFDLPLKLSSYKDTENMINDLGKSGWKNVQVKLSGWFNRGYEHSVPTRVKLISELGSTKDFRNMVSAAGKNGYDLYPEADFLYMRDVKPFDGFNLYTYAARYVNRKRIEKYPYSFVWFGERFNWGKLSYISSPAAMINMINGFSKKISALGMKNIAFRSMGSVLAGDYNEKNRVSREAAMNMRQKELAELSQGGKLMVNSGYAYSVPWADFITNMAIGDQAFAITDDSVPFCQIVLHGLVPYTGRPINLAEDYTKNLLKTVECGAGLYFSFMAAETAVLQETKFKQFYSNEYGKWSGDANALYQKFSEDFSGLYIQAITDHKILAPGLTLTQYEDGTRVIVNAGEINRNYENYTIAANSYLVLRGVGD